MTIKPLSNSHNSVNRRNFLKLSGMLGLGLAVPAAFPAVSEAVRFDKKNYKVSKTRLAMGTYVSMTLIHPSKDQAEKAMDLAFEEIIRLSNIMGRFDESTAISQLNKEGFIRDINPEAAFVVSKALDYYKVTQGNFDITVKPVIDLFTDNFSGGKTTPPSDTELNKAFDLVNAKAVQIQGRGIRLTKPGMGITLDGIAKGYIVDRASKTLFDNGIKNHLINAGGDIRTRGSKGDNKSWTIAIEDPHKKQQYPGMIKLKDGAVATSGNYEVYFDREKMFNHIVSPKKGISSILNTSVSVVAGTAMDADALSTSVFVMDQKAGISFINNMPDCECFTIDNKGVKFRSLGWHNITA